MMAAHYLDVPQLLDLCTDAMADHIRGKSPAQVRECFGLKPNLAPEEVRSAASCIPTCSSLPLRNLNWNIVRYHGHAH